MDHDCSGCLGKIFQGANLTCNRCLRPFYLECLAQKKEIQYLIAALNAYTPATSSPVALPSKFKHVFGAESVFDFTCIKCKSSGSFIDNVVRAKEDISRECNETDGRGIKRAQIENRGNASEPQPI